MSERKKTTKNEKWIVLVYGSKKSIDKVVIPVGSSYIVDRFDGDPTERQLDHFLKICEVSMKRLLKGPEWNVKK